jgi:hypothetical protein
MPPRPLGPLVRRWLNSSVPAYAAAKEVLRSRSGESSSAAVFVLSAIVAVGCAGAVLWHASRSFVRRRETVCWSAFAFVAGLPALLTYMALDPGPELEKCADCGHPKPMRDPECPHCGTSVPEPATTGREIFT